MKKKANTAMLLWLGTDNVKGKWHLLQQFCVAFDKLTDTHDIRDNVNIMCTYNPSAHNLHGQYWWWLYQLGGPVVDRWTEGWQESDSCGNVSGRGCQTSFSKYIPIILFIFYAGYCFTCSTVQQWLDITFNCFSYH